LKYKYRLLTINTDNTSRKAQRGIMWINRAIAVIYRGVRIKDKEKKYHGDTKSIEIIF
jgi:hypothetical protein